MTDDGSFDTALQATERLDRLEDLFLASERERRRHRTTILILIAVCVLLAAAVAYLLLSRSAPAADRALALGPEELLIQTRVEVGGPECLYRISAWKADLQKWNDRRREGMSLKELHWRNDLLLDQTESLRGQCGEWMTYMEWIQAGGSDALWDDIQRGISAR